MIRAKYDSRKLTRRFAQFYGYFAQASCYVVSFKLRSNYFIYLIYQLFVWALLVADVNLGYMHLSTKYYTL